jgi:hypothetical protein
MPTKRQRRKRRRRQSSTGPAPVPAPAPAAAPRKRSADDRPAAPWGSFPLSEIVILIGILIFLPGFFVTPPQGLVMIGVGIGLVSLAGLELAIREHFSGYRSHNLLFGGAIGVPIFGALLLATTIPTPVCIAVGLVAFGGAAWLFASAFRRRSGGALYRLRG